MKINIITPKHQSEKEKIVKSIYEILEENILLTLSTIKNNEPYSCSAYYVFDKNFNLYIWTEKESTHSKNISKNPLVAVNIANTSQKFGSELKGLQMHGGAKIVSGPELIKAGTLYVARFPKVSKYVKKIKDFVSKEFESEIYKIEIKEIKLLDEKTFGKEEYRIILIER